MEQPKCSCTQFNRLEGASVPAYINAFLDKAGDSNSSDKNLYRCRICGREWKRRAPEVKSESTRASLVRVG